MSADPPTTAMLKKAWRQRFCVELAGRDANEEIKARQRLGKAAAEHCRESLAPGAVVALFGGLADEADLMKETAPELWGSGFSVALFGLMPEGEKGRMEARLVEGPGEMVRGRFGVWEPDPGRTRLLEPGDLAMVMVPGIYFDAESGVRLGRGGGYYDRFLARTPPTVQRVGVAMEWQLTASLPADEHDQRMDWLVTEQRRLRCGAVI